MPSQSNKADLENIAQDTTPLDEMAECIRSAKNWPLERQQEYFEATKNLFGDQLPKEMEPINYNYVKNELLNSMMFRRLCGIPNADREDYIYAVMAGIAMYCRRKTMK